MRLSKSQLSATRKPKLCEKCKKETCLAQYSKLYEGNLDSGILLIRYSVSEEEAQRNRLWCDDSGYHFRGMMDAYYKSVEDICTTTLVRCPHEKIAVRHLRNCRDKFDKLFAMRKWDLIICSGRDALRHAFMRGGAPPALDVLAGRFVKMPETGDSQITTIPDTASMCLLGAEDSVEEMQARGQMMRECLNEMAKETGEIHGY